MDIKNKKQLTEEIVGDAYELYDKFYDSFLEGNANMIIDNSKNFDEKEIAVAETIRLISVLIDRLCDKSIWNELVGYKKDIEKMYDNLNF